MSNQRYTRVFLFLSFVSVIFMTLTSRCSEKAMMGGFDEYISGKMKYQNIPGLAALLVKDDEIVWSGNYGWADIEKRIPMSNERILPTASITKTITATAVMQLWEQGKFNLNDPVNDYLSFEILNPNHPDSAITFFQLLNHTSSISNGPSLWRTFRCGDPVISHEDWVEGYFLPDGQFYHADGNFEKWPPGLQAQYSNAGYGLLGYMVEVLSGMPFEQYCRTFIFEPLSMNYSSIHPSTMDAGLFSSIYAYDFEWDLERDLVRPGIDVDRALADGRPVPLCLYSSPTRGAGGLYASASDLAHFLIALMNGGIYREHRILKSETLDTMFQAYGDFGLGVYAVPLDNGELVWGHTGADPGVSTFMLFNSDVKLGAIVVTNRFVDIRDLIHWIFAEGFRYFCTQSLDDLPEEWKQYSAKAEKHFGPERKVTFRITPKVFPAGSTVFITGNHRYLGQWNPTCIPLMLQQDGSWSRTFRFFEGAELEYKITRGSWEKEAVFADGRVPPNFTFHVQGDMVVNVVVENWKDNFKESDR